MHNIQQYSSDSSSEDDDENSTKNLPKQNLLPPSSDLLRVPAESAPAVEDDPAKHQGRVRSFAHERGIWASYVYVDYNDVEPMDDLQQQIIEKASKNHGLELNQVDNLHLSLTKTFVIRHHNITAFVESIRTSISGFKRFTVIPSNLAIYVNEEQTRTFLAVKIADISYGPLNQLVDSLDGCMREYKLPVFYQDRSFHVSILWTLGDQRAKLEAILAELEELFAAIYEEDYCDINVNVKRLHLKCGNKFYDFQLDAIKKLKDGITADLIKMGQEKLSDWLHQLIVKIWDTERQPQEWKKEFIWPIFSFFTRNQNSEFDMFRFA